LCIAAFATSTCQSVEYSSSPLNVFFKRVNVIERPSDVHAICGEKIPPGSVGAIVQEPLVIRRAFPPLAETIHRCSGGVSDDAV
jgi:hypothetical protein